MLWLKESCREQDGLTSNGRRIPPTPLQKGGSEVRAPLLKGVGGILK
jgi:hypothetical protein